LERQDREPPGEPRDAQRDVPEPDRLGITIGIRGSGDADAVTDLDPHGRRPLRLPRSDADFERDGVPASSASVAVYATARSRLGLNGL
jgi:hypothetical protein